jgi:hypothetical protein
MVAQIVTKGNQFISLPGVNSDAREWQSIPTPSVVSSDAQEK